ncbi:Hypothetical protein A7982_10945 [Minicystis rosea]|nr:Hypothetical protein A7982_10945 [Minicystis rosea]
MGSARPGPRRTGTLVELYTHFFDVARGYIPPFDALDDKLATGLDRAGEHGIHLRWTPLQIDRAEHAQFCEDLRHSTARRYEEIEAPPELRTWEAWSWWIYTTQIQPTLSTSEAGGPSRDEIALRRAYRKALATGDAAAALRLAAEIRERYDPSFS